MISPQDKVKRIHFVSFFIPFIIFGSLSQLFSQDSNYWSNQYGTTSELLGGIVVGSIKDLSSTFYNPGAISLSRDEKLSLTTNSFNINTLTLENSGAKGIDLSGINVSVAPSIFAVRLTNSKNDHQWAISYLTRYQFEIEINNADIDPYDPDSLASFYSGSGNFNTNLTEGWGGLTWAYHVDDKIGFGITQFIAYRGQNENRIGTANLYSEETGTSNAISQNNYSYYNIRTLWKIGAAFDLNPVKLGVTITTPSLNLFGFGSVYSNLSVARTLNDSLDDYLSSYDAKDLKTKFKNPLSIAIGASYQFKKSAIHFTAEWFNSTAQYNIMPTQYYRSQSHGVQQIIAITDEAQSVINLGIAYNYTVDSTLSYYAALTTDNTYYTQNNSNNIGIASIDIYYLTLGSLFEIDTYNVTLGGNFGYGSDRVDQYFNLLNTLLPDLGYEAPKITAKYFRFKIVFGISFN